MSVGPNTYRYLITDNERYTKILIVRLKFLGYTFQGSPIVTGSPINIDMNARTGILELYRPEDITEEYLDTVRYVLINTELKRIIWMLTESQAREISFPGRHFTEILIDMVRDIV